MELFRQNSEKYETNFVTVDQAIQKCLLNQTTHHNKLTNHELRLCKIEEKILIWNTYKMNVDDFEIYKNKIRQELIENQFNMSNNSNHFAMVENFVEKYVPVRI